MIESIVITKNGNLGYVASLRFKDPTLNEELSNTSHEGIYAAINYAMTRKGIRG